MSEDYEPGWCPYCGEPEALCRAGGGCGDEARACCEGCGLPTYGEGRSTADDVYLCGPCYDAVPAARIGADRPEEG